MNAALIALFQSKKFWVGMLTIVSLLVSLVLCIAGKIAVADLGTYAASLASVGMSVIGFIAWNDVATAKLEMEKVKLEAAKLLAEKK